MGNISLVLLAAGSSTRFGLPVKKQWLRTGQKPLWQFVADRFAKLGTFSDIIITASAQELPYMRLYGDYHIVTGGASRQESLRNALNEVSSEYVLVSDVARACFEQETLQRLTDAIQHADVAVPVIDVSDTVVYHNETIDREHVKRVQTPQLSRTSVLKQALQSSEEFTDDSSAVVAAGGKRVLVNGSQEALKITFPQDLLKASCLQPPAPDTFSGTGFDVHAFDTTKKSLMLCGVEVPCGYGFLAHSDGDVAIHALIDALLGASGMGDIGELFPDTDERYAGIDSKKLLQDVLQRLRGYGFELVNIDLTIIAQKPRLGSYKQEFRKTLAQLTELPPVHVNIKATTTEKLGFTGRGEGVAVMASANLKYYNWMQGHTN